MNGTSVVERQEVVEDAPIEQIITDDFIAKFEKQADLYQNRYLPICLKLTNESDWIDHGKKDAPKYSLQCSGAEKVCNPLGMVWDRPVVTKHERDDEKGKYYEYEVEGVLQSRVLKRYGWFTGNCSSRDVFFNARGSFDEGDIRKAAFSNWLVNGVTRLAGIRNPTPAMLAKAGLKPEQIGRIDYSGRKTEDQEKEVISEPQRKRLWAKCKSQNVSEEVLRIYLVETYTFKSTSEITKGTYEAICAWADRGGQEEPK